MTIADVHFGDMLNQWQQYTEGKKVLPNQESLQKLLTDSLNDLEQANRTFLRRIESNNINKITICELSKLSETISRIAQCLLHNTDLIRNQHIDPSITRERMERLTSLETSIQEKILNSLSPEIMPPSALEKLHLLQENSPALDALISENGLLNTSILSKALDAWSSELIYRLLHNANLNTVEDLISLFQENADRDVNIISLLQNHVKNSQKEAKTQMSPAHNIAFDRQWKTPQQRDWIYNNTITPFTDCNEAEKMDAWDFQKQIHIEMERSGLKPEEKFLRGVSLYKGEMHDYYLCINRKNSSESGRQLLGEENYKKLGDWSTYFWSPDGTSFFEMKSKGFRGTAKSYQSSFETEEGKKDAQVKIQANDVFAFAFENNHTLTRYERLDLSAARTLCSRIKNGQAQLTPYIVAREPEYLFQMENGSYIYVDSNYGKNTYNFSAYFDTDGAYQTQAIKNVSRLRDGGTTQIEFENGSSIFCPVGTEEGPSYTNSQGQKQSLQKIDTKDFDYTRLGIELEEMNPRPTMMDLF